MTFDVASTCVFLGPSLGIEEARAILPGARYLPPAGLGDIHALALRRDVRTICLIDGRFLATPAVWHKEILFALGRGIAVCGAASMGALRAAELHTLGMQGFGQVFRQYADGTLEDDDEVAVLHGPAELGYPAFSLAMASLRYGVERARQAGLVDDTGAAALCQHMKALHFTRRSPDALARAVREEPGVAEGPAADALLRYLGAPEQDRKRLDALEMLSALAAGEIASQALGPFEETAFWRQFAERRQGRGHGAQPAGAEDVMWGYFNLRDRGDGGAGGEHGAAWMETLEELAARLLSIEPEPAAVQRFLELLRREHGLLDAAAVRDWLAERGCEPAVLRDWAHARARRRMLQARLRPGFLRKLQAAALRAPDYAGHRDALERRMALPRTELERGAGPDRIGALWQLYADAFGGRAMPLQLAADDRGFDAPDAFLDALLREYLLAGGMGDVDDSGSISCERRVG